MTENERRLPATITRAVTARVLRALIDEAEANADVDLVEKLRDALDVAAPLAHELVYDFSALDPEKSDRDPSDQS